MEGRPFAGRTHRFKARGVDPIAYMADEKGTTRILVVDDEAPIRDVVPRLIAIRLRSLGPMSFATAANADEALRYLEEHEVDLVLTDYRMPGRNGADLLTIVRERWPKTHRVMMSGYREIRTEAGPQVDDVVEGFITKPWDLDDFADILLMVLESEATP